MRRNREWLRSFLQLGARAEKDGIPAADVERQENTVLRALDMLEERPGIVLADEVGMGKTYEALGIAAATHHRNHGSRIVVITPGPDLNTKWTSEFSRFRELYRFDKDVAPAYGLAEFVKRVRVESSVVVAPITMFQSGRGSGDQAYLLSLYFHWKQLHGNTANAIMRRFGDGASDRVDVAAEKFLGEFGLASVEPHLRKAFCGTRGELADGLDDLYESRGVDAFENADAVRSALYRARFVLTGKLIPTIDLLIVDEAHKLKNPGSLRTRAMRSVFDKRFGKALFLTATPFQLDVSELREVFALFAVAQGAPANLEEGIKELLDCVKKYQHQYDAFQRTWSSLDPVVAARFCARYDNPQSASDGAGDPTLDVITQQVADLQALKTKHIEPGFRQWMIRSLREDKRIYRKHVRKPIPARGVDAFPFLVYERFIAELFRRRRQTHKTAVEINMVSSYAAARKGEILSKADGIPPEAEAYRSLLGTILGEIESDAHGHPKIADAIRDAVDSAERGEKTLVFCARIATLEQLQRQLDAAWELRVLDRWRRAYPNAREADIFDTHGDDERHQGRHSKLQTRFQRPQHPLYLALREPYLRTLVPIADWARQNLGDVTREANRILADVRVGKTAAERLDYLLAKRCVEQAAIRLCPHTPDHRYMTHLLDADYLRLGLDLVADAYEEDSIGDEQPGWQISERVAQMVIGSEGSLWEAQVDLLNALPRALRVRVVEQLARYLTYKQVPFLADLLGEAVAAGVEVDTVESAALLDYLPSFWHSEVGTRWREQLRAFLVYFSSRDDRQQSEILDGPIRTGKFARHTGDGESRERLREAFNTPLFPMVLVANEVMQEGLDLHQQCRRIVHHDLVWNPAQIEQRIGRIDRLGSLTSRLRKNGTGATLDVLYPVIRGTIDERLFRTVKSREKWLEFLLGATPDFTQYTLADEEPPPLPDKLGRDLAIDLGPRSTDY